MYTRIWRNVLEASKLEVGKEILKTLDRWAYFSSKT